jgi:hypothetical protein
MNIPGVKIRNTLIAVAAVTFTEYHPPSRGVPLLADNRTRPMSVGVTTWFH